MCGFSGGTRIVVVIVDVVMKIWKLVNGIFNKLYLTNPGLYHSYMNVARASTTKKSARLQQNLSYHTCELNGN